MNILRQNSAFAWDLVSRLVWYGDAQGDGEWRIDTISGLVRSVFPPALIPRPVFWHFPYMGNATELLSHHWPLELHVIGSGCWLLWVGYMGECPRELRDYLRKWCIQ